jgi:hypothetical protein
VTDFRKYMNLFESNDFGTDDAEIEEAFVPFKKKGEEDASDEDDKEEIEEGEEELVEFLDTSADDAGLEGVLDPRQLAKLLPEVDDLTRFVNAVQKVKKGDIAALSIQEYRQLAKGFISLLKDDSQMTTKVLQRLKMVHGAEADTGL